MPVQLGLQCLEATFSCNKLILNSFLCALESNIQHSTCSFTSICFLLAETREVLLQKLRNRRNEPVETSEGVKADNGRGEGSLSRAYEVSPETPSAEPGVKSEIHPEDTKERLEDEEADACTSSDTQKPPENEEDVSFSDLEDDDNDLSVRLSRLKPTEDERVPSQIRSSKWVRLNENSGTKGGDGQKAGQSTSREKDSEGEESNDWLTVDENDFDSLAAV
ncbi:hypothetical protein Acr_13g0011090 [Actinidia rufa]|uniref:BSD domain-containing protein n=1 Tax=Actinidia rufa TaxID=165716 RepID=A0A7J0FNI1_9ERIC|nr:hypothetical protein Acr_13g0011090 [Actinidia rufa]